MSERRLNDELEELDRQECLQLLGEEKFGRIGVVSNGRPEIFPLNYALDPAGGVVFRTAAGTKLAAAINHQVVFEVDRVDAVRRAGWSVIVHGVAHHTERIPASTRSLVPWLHDQPYLIRITPVSVTGRRLGHR